MSWKRNRADLRIFEGSRIFKHDKKRLPFPNGKSRFGGMPRGQSRFLETNRCVGLPFEQNGHCAFAERDETIDHERDVPIAFLSRDRARPVQWHIRWLILWILWTTTYPVGRDNVLIRLLIVRQRSQRNILFGKSSKTREMNHHKALLIGGLDRN